MTSSSSIVGSSGVGCMCTSPFPYEQVSGTPATLTDISHTLFATYTNIRTQVDVSNGCAILIWP